VLACELICDECNAEFRAGNVKMQQCVCIADCFCLWQLSAFECCFVVCVCLHDEPFHVDRCTEAE